MGKEQTECHRRLLAILLFVIPRGDCSFEEAVPTPDQCPTCAYANFTCDRQCSAGQSYAFDFRYNMGQCWEYIPKDGRSMLNDIDLWCALNYTRFFLRCLNMNDYDFTGVDMIQGCKSDATASALVRESCEWVCKHGRPTARCLWEFDHAGIYFNGRLRACWLDEECGAQTSVVTTVCEPNPPENATSDILTLQSDLSAALAAHHVAQQELTQAQAERDSYSQNFGNLTHDELVAQRETEKARLDSAEQTLYVAEERLSGITAELREAQKELETAIRSHANTSAAHEEDKKQLRSMLSQATAELNSSRLSLSSALANHSATKTALRQQAKNLLQEVQRYADLLAAERAEHDETKLKLKSQETKTEEAQTWLALVLVAFGIIMIACCGVIVILMFGQRKWRNLALSTASNMGAHVVLGRPVGASASPEEDSKSTFQAHQALPVKPGPVDIEEDQDELRRLQSNPGRPVVEASSLQRSSTGTLKAAWSS